MESKSIAILKEAAKLCAPINHESSFSYATYCEQEGIFTFREAYSIRNQPSLYWSDRRRGWVDSNIMHNERFVERQAVAARQEEVFTPYQNHSIYNT